MKYYLYISDKKVDMLYSQIPETIKNKIAAEIKIQIPLLSVSFKDKEKQPEDTRYTKLELVVEYMKKHLDIGTYADPKAYFKDTLPMHWAQIGEELVYFTYSSRRATLGLGGSAHHLIERRGEGNTDLDPLRYSNDQNIIAGLSKVLNIPNPGYIRDSNRDLSENLPPNEAKHALYAVERAIDCIQGPVHKLEFLARRLAIETAPAKTIVLGTPIYVAFAE